MNVPVQKPAGEQSRNLWLIGLGFAAFIVIAAINAPAELRGHDSLIPLWGPLNLIRSYNRWICLFLALGLIFGCRAMDRQTSWWKLEAITAIFLGLHCLIFLKNIFSIGAAAIVYLAGLVILLLLTRLLAELMVSRTMSVPGACWSPLVLASMGFLGVNLFQYIVNPSATMLLGGRFNGITSNPEMFALSTAITIPAMLFFYTQKRGILFRILVAVSFLILVFFMLRSGSRLSLLMAVIAILMYFRAKVAKLAAFVLPVVLLGLVWILVSDPANLFEGSHITSTENTRSQVWRDQLDSIVDHPLLGHPLAEGERVNFGENSYLAAGSTLGLTGLVLAVCLAVAICRQLWNVLKIERRVGWRPELALPIALLSTCLVGGFFEAFLLGIFTFPLTAMLYTLYATEAASRQIQPATVPVRMIQKPRPLPAGGKRRMAIAFQRSKSGMAMRPLRRTFAGKENKPKM